MALTQKEKDINRRNKKLEAERDALVARIQELMYYYEPYNMGRDAYGGPLLYWVKRCVPHLDAYVGAYADEPSTIVDVWAGAMEQAARYVEGVPEKIRVANLFLSCAEAHFNVCMAKSHREDYVRLSIPLISVDDKGAFDEAKTLEALRGRKRRVEKTGLSSEFEDRDIEAFELFINQEVRVFGGGVVRGF
jgi:hypothetical protein